MGFDIVLCLANIIESRFIRISPGFGIERLSSLKGDRNYISISYTKWLADLNFFEVEFSFPGRYFGMAFSSGGFLPIPVELKDMQGKSEGFDSFLFFEFTPAFLCFIGKHRTLYIGGWTPLELQMFSGRNLLGGEIGLCGGWRYSSLDFSFAFSGFRWGTLRRSINMGFLFNFRKSYRFRFSSGSGYSPVRGRVPVRGGFYYTRRRSSPVKMDFGFTMAVFSEPSYSDFFPVLGLNFLFSKTVSVSICGGYHLFWQVFKAVFSVGLFLNNLSLKYSFLWDSYFTAHIIDLGIGL